MFIVLVGLFSNLWKYANDQFHKKIRKFQQKSDDAILAYRSLSDSRISNCIPIETAIDVYDRSTLNPHKVGEVKIAYPNIKSLNDPHGLEPIPEISFSFDSKEASRKHSEFAVQSAIQYLNQYSFKQARVHVANNEYNVSHNLGLRESSYNLYQEQGKGNSYEIDFRPGFKDSLIKREKALFDSFITLVREQPNIVLKAMDALLVSELTTRTRNSPNPPELIGQIDQDIQELDGKDQYLMPSGKIIEITDAQRLKDENELPPPQKTVTKSVSKMLKDLDRLVDDNPNIIDKVEKIIAQQKQKRQERYLKDITKLMSGDKTGKTAQKFQDTISRKKASLEKSQSKTEKVVELKQEKVKERSQERELEL